MATKDRTALKDEFKNGNLATGERFADLIDSMKVVQEPVADPAASGTSLSFIDSISQNADGKITATKKTLDLANAHELNPFKGWYKTGDTLPTDGFDGAYLYFKDTSEQTGLTTIYRWNGTAYADSGVVVDTSNVNTFKTGQALNGVAIDGTGLANPLPNALAKAEDVKEMGDGIKAEIVDVVNLAFVGDTDHVCAYEPDNPAKQGFADTSSAYFGCYKTDVSRYVGKQIKFLGCIFPNTEVGAAFYNGEPSDDTFMLSSYISFQESGATGGGKDYTAIVPEGAKYFICTWYKYGATDFNKTGYYIRVKSSKITEVDDRVAELENQLLPYKELPYAYDGGNVVKDVGYFPTSSLNFGCYKTDVSRYVGKTIKYYGFINETYDVGAAFFNDDGIINNTYNNFKVANANGGGVEYTAVVPAGATEFGCTVYDDGTNDYNKSGYYIDVVLNTDIEEDKSDYPCYHTNERINNFGSYADLIAAYDALVTAYPHYVFKRELSADGVTDGLVSDGVNKLYEYRFAMPNYNDSTHTNNNRSRDAQINKPKILICAGVHGSEISAITSVYIFAKDLCKGKGVLSALSAGYDVRIIPSCNPWGMDNNRRGNMNGVDLNRNFVAEGQNFEPFAAPAADYQYTVNCGRIYDYATNPTPTAATYTPGTVGDQPETKLVMAWAAANADAVAFFDTHNSLYNNEYGYIGALSGLDEPIKRHCFHSVDKAIPYFINERKLRYPYKIGSSAAEAVFLYSGGGTKGHNGKAGTMSQYRLSNNLNGGTLEFCHTINTQTGVIAQYTAMIGTIGAEVLGNILMGIAEAFDVSKVKTICAGSAMPKGGRDFVVIAWNTTTNKPQMWNGTEWVTLQVEQ